MINLNSICFAINNSKGTFMPRAFVQLFQQENCYRFIDGKDCLSKANWPAAAGVYAVKHEDDLVYIGKTGKVVPTREGSVQLNSGRLSGRLARSTPYCFQKKGAYAGFFEYGPNFSVNDLSKQDYESRYRVHIPISKIAVHCFILQDHALKVPPAVVEALLLTYYMAKYGRLPHANQEL